MKWLVLLGFLAFWLGMASGFIIDTKNARISRFKESVIHLSLLLPVIIFTALFIYYG